MPITAKVAAVCVAAVNQARAKLGKRALIHDPRLSVAAQASADKSSIHGRFVERFKEAGWPVEGRPPHDSRPDIGNFSEGTAPKGPKSFPEAVGQYIWMMTESNLASDPTEPHVWDFRTGWSRVGFGLNPKNGFFVIAYGYLPDDPDQAPTPEPEPAPDPAPTPAPDPTPGPTPGPDDESGWTFIMHR